jgi:hypothetical protein
MSGMVYERVSTVREFIPSLTPMATPDKGVIKVVLSADHQKSTSVTLSMEAALMLIADLSAHVRDHLLCEKSNNV